MSHTIHPPARMTLPIVEHAAIASHARLIVLDAPHLAPVCTPGQFVHVLCGAAKSSDPLLRRPLSVHDADLGSGQVSLLYEIRGRGTDALSHKSVGESLDIIGPLGQGFTLPQTAEQPLLLVGGGIAIAPLYFLARRIADTIGCERTTFVIGARSECFLICVDKFRDLGGDVRVATNDGTEGFHGFVTGLIEEYLSESDKADSPLVYVCGPMPMLKAVSVMTNRHKLKCWISTEARMACGVGACMSCVIKVRDGGSSKYVRCCREGPVFDADEVIWE